MFDGCAIEGERLDDLLLDGMKVIQRPDQFCFSLDSPFSSLCGYKKERCSG